MFLLSTINSRNDLTIVKPNAKYVVCSEPFASIFKSEKPFSVKKFLIPIFCILHRNDKAFGANPDCNGAVINNIPPGFIIREISFIAEIGSGICSITSVHKITSNDLSGTGILRISITNLSYHSPSGFEFDYLIIEQNREKK